MSETDSAEETELAPELVPSPGEMLAQAREFQGLTRLRVSEVLGLTQSIIRDIELCRFEKFPSGIYVRGYIRNYCKLVELDEEKVLAAYDQYAETHEVPDESPFGSNEPKVEGPGKTIALGIGMALVIVAILVTIIIFG